MRKMIFGVALCLASAGAWAADTFTFTWISDITSLAVGFGSFGVLNNPIDGTVSGATGFTYASYAEYSYGGGLPVYFASNSLVPPSVTFAAGLPVSMSLYGRPGGETLWSPTGTFGIGDAELSVIDNSFTYREYFSSSFTAEHHAVFDQGHIVFTIPVPEPATWAMLGFGLMAMSMSRRGRNTD